MLDYINKDPIFPDSKYELYGDFEPPFYHFSKGLGFDEIENLIERNLFDDFGVITWTDKHSYTLPPYLKLKYGFKSKHDYYTESQIDYAAEKGFPDLESAVLNRNQVVETSLSRAQVACGKPFLNFEKFQNNESYARLHRFEGFTDYDNLDKFFNL